MKPAALLLFVFVLVSVCPCLAVAADSPCSQAMLMDLAAWKDAQIPAGQSTSAVQVDRQGHCGFRDAVFGHLAFMQERMESARAQGAQRVATYLMMLMQSFYAEAVQEDRGASRKNGGPTGCFTGPGAKAMPEGELKRCFDSEGASPTSKEKAAFVDLSPHFQQYASMAVRVADALAGCGADPAKAEKWADLSSAARQARMIGALHLCMQGLAQAAPIDSADRRAAKALMAETDTILDTIAGRFVAYYDDADCPECGLAALLAHSNVTVFLRRDMKAKRP